MIFERKKYLDELIRRTWEWTCEDYNRCQTLWKVFLAI